jgi:hypothetical protein
MRAISIAVLGGALAAAPLAAAQQVQEPLTNVRVVEATWIRDVAMMRREAGRPVIYVNPRLLERFGPVMRDFFIAHEYGHVAHGHDLGNFAHDDGHAWRADEDSVLMRTRQRQELEADCYAASRLALSNRPSIQAAVRYFTRMGPYRFDRVHPTGSQRAANLLACVAAADAEPAPDSLLAPAIAAATGAVVVELAPVTREHLVGHARVIVDGRSLGTLSTLLSQPALVVRDLGEGQHRYEVRLELFEHDERAQPVPAGVVIGTGTLDVRRGMRLEIHWLGEEPPALLPVGTAAVAGA